MARLRGAAWIGALALAVWLVWGHGFANYDALYSLVWGRELADGHGPSYDVSLAPTPHPLANLGGLALSPFTPRTGEDVLVVIAFLSLGAVGWLVYALGARWFGVAAGVLAAALFLTREPVLSYGTRAYVDVPYLALVPGALLAVERRRSPPPWVGGAAGPSGPPPPRSSCWRGPGCCAPRRGCSPPRCCGGAGAT